MPCFWSFFFPQSVPEFLHHSYQVNFCVCEILVLGNPLPKSERCLRRWSSSHLDPLSCVPVHLENVCRSHEECLPLVVFFQFGDTKSLWHVLALCPPCRLSAQFEFADNKPIICRTVCTTVTLTACLSFLRAMI